MKIRIIRNKLVEGLSFVKDACEGKDALNILRCVKLETADKEIVLTATNLTITVRTHVECEVVEAGSAALVGASLFGFSNALPEGVIEIELKDGAKQARISGGNCRYALAVGDIANWPKMAEIGRDAKGETREVVKYALQSKTLKELFRKVKYAASTDGTRHALCGVNLETKNGKLTVIATDGRRLSFCEYALEEVGESSIIVQTKTLTQIEKMIGKEENDILVETDGQQSRFSEGTGRWELQAKLVSEIYPNWRQVVPRELTNVATVDRGLLKDELGRVALSAEMRGSDKFVKFTVEDGRIILESCDSDYSKAKTELVVKYAGEKISCSMNPDLVKDVLGCVDDDDMEIAFGNGTGPVTFKCQIPFVGIVMPLRTN